MALGSMTTRPALLLRIAADDGAFGWGEVWANFPARANIHKAHLIEDVIVEKLKGQSFVDPREVNDALRKALSVFFLHVGQIQVFEHILAGIDTALWDLALRASGQSFAQFIGQDKLAPRSYASSINTDDVDRLIPKHAALGQTHFKLKVGFAEHGNRDIVERANAVCPPGAHIMVDSNQSWSLEQAKICLESIGDLTIFFAEEPLRANAPKSDWEELANATDVPLAAGENIYGIDAFLSMADAGLRVFQPDVAKWGGVSGALDLAKVMPDGVLLWPHFMGSAVGQMAALSVTAATGPASACEMDVNENPLRTDLCGDAISVHGGVVDLPDAPGLVAPPLHTQLEHLLETHGT